MKHILITTIAAVVLVGCGEHEPDNTQVLPGESPNLPIREAKPLPPAFQSEPLIDPSIAANAASNVPISPSTENLAVAVSSPTETPKKDLLLIEQFIKDGYKNKKKIRPIRHRVGYDKKRKQPIMAVIGTFVEFENGMTVINNSRTKTTEAYIMPPETLERKENDDAELRYLKQKSKIYDARKKIVGYLIHEGKWYKVRKPTLTPMQRIGAASSVIMPSPWVVDNIMTKLDGTKTATLYLGSTISISGDFPWVEKNPTKTDDSKSVE
jgi:hypothetical protein